ncbi:hypothetical protein [Algoriphagus hitonicola]|uniref:Uncharacterized protein n=1 Tax=Algoriphagus hitonicola TaxID=435880 RepID=A0A1I2NPP4_9BACT|nr:hypothetical protein [Algoriphagus hitonicola]SFG03416.1 hypothetical protein SAMN04487988_101138 [Algoriphagus hitonicola]
MKSKSILSTAVFLFSFYWVNAQSSSTWEIPMIEVNYQDSKGEEAILKVDPGFRYAELESEERNYRLFYHRNRPFIKDIRILDQRSDSQIARGKGGFFFGNARIEFADGSEIKLRRKRSPNGYEITGTYGPLFLVKNHAFTPTKTFEESDFLAQAMFLFRRIQETQNPPTEVIYQNHVITSNR